MVRVFYLRCLLILALGTTAPAQIHGIPASASSLAAPTRFGIPASVSSLGPNGFSDPTVPRFSSVEPMLEPTMRLGGRHHHRDDQFFPVAYPVYVYPAISYDPEPEVVRAPPPAEPQRIIVEIRDTREQKPAPPQPPAKEESKDLHEKSAAPERPSDPVVLIYLDGHKQEIRDYAIMGGTLFDLSDGGTKKIPLDTLNIAATKKINDDRGVSFKVPETMAKR